MPTRRDKSNEWKKDKEIEAEKVAVIEAGHDEIIFITKPCPHSRLAWRKWRGLQSPQPHRLQLQHVRLR